MALNIYQQIAESLNKAKKIFIALAENPKGDLLGSAFALSEIFKAQSKKSIIAAQGDINFYKGIINISQVQNSTFQSRKLVISLNNSNNLKKFYWQKENRQIENQNNNQTPNHLYISSGNLKEKYESLVNQSNSLMANTFQKVNIYLVPQKGHINSEDISIYQGSFDYDLIIALGTPDLESLGNIYSQNTDFFHETPILNIDYKLSNEKFGEINLIESTKSSVSEILFYLLDKNYPQIFNRQNIKPVLTSKYNQLIDFTTQAKVDLPQIVTYLLLGIIDETKNFKKPTVSPQTLNTTARLLEFKADREKIIKTLYYNKSVNIMKLWGRALARLKLYSPENILVSLLNDEDFEKSKTTKEDIFLVFNETSAILEPSQFLVMLVKAGEYIHVYIKQPVAYDKDLEKIFWQKKCQKISDEVIYFKIKEGKILEVEKEVVNMLKN